jgi:hypothetical protein
MQFDPKWLTVGLSDEQVRGAIIVGWRLVLVAHIAFACGWLTFLGLPGFALASDQRNTDAKLTKILQLQISERIRSLSYERCVVIGHDAKARKAGEIEEWQLQYKQISGERYPEPGC